MKINSIFLIAGLFLGFSQLLLKSVSAQTPLQSYTDCTANDPPVKFLSQTSPPGQMQPGEQATVSITLANCSSETWLANGPGGESFKLGSQNPIDNMTWGIGRVNFPLDIPQNNKINLSFNVTAPANEGTYVFQFGLLQESVRWYLPSGPPAIVSVGRVFNCPEANTVKNSAQSATLALQGCIDRTPAGTVLEIPPGVYTLTDQLKIKKKLTLRTQGLAGNTQTCLLNGSLPCAEFKAGSTFPQKRVLWSDTLGLINIAGISGANGPVPTDEVNLDHIILNGNRAARGQLLQMCNEPKNMHHCVNTEWYSSNSKIFYSASINSLMGSGFWIHGNNNTLAFNLFANNGQNLTGKTEWSDGLTSTSSKNAIYMYNTFRDNSDTDLIIADGGGARIHFNRIIHNRKDSASWAGLMLDNFNSPDLSDFQNSDISYNTIDCRNRCAFGIMIGGTSWYGKNTNLAGPAVHHNTIGEAGQGINVAGAGTSGFPLFLGPNFISGSGGLSTGCGNTSGILNVGPNNVVSFMGLPNPDTAFNWTQCTFNLANLKTVSFSTPLPYVIPIISTLPIITISPAPTVTPTTIPSISPSVTLSPQISISPAISLPPAFKSGDANGDNKVDGVDYVIWLLNYNKTVTTGFSAGDFDTNGFVDGLDYVIWLQNYNK